ncbi:(2Fe-2S) ferredoxin domain-containing protein [Spirulina major CS-329]|uniref:(2Fe-2S) ferredoxin domain-containing protein n=1 Tax=Spirulina TaxID=1154 RepID=UPI00232BFFC9|nr:MULTISPECIES: (2Fe-2S) ferredoxin domain-containing protein [Spirulina]MDB9496319.1 (2Fe-2S) ferredoxin domain-containing protein [Spirulina subsalsa CS-330]MDB9502016.1 (2Fe-2S) ferredoxin domain-containing protein [Spirulina major CS-329]
MSYAKAKPTPIRCTGQLQSLFYQDGAKLKALRVGVDDRDYWFKVPKTLRHRLDPTIQPGHWVTIHGQRRRSRKTGILTFKADHIILSPWAVQSELVAAPLNPPQPKAEAAKILICQKSSCRKRGADKVCAQLAAELSDRNLSDTVTIKSTGCLNQCKQGPHVILLPERAKYSRVRPNDIPTLVEQHLIIDPQA